MTLEARQFRSGPHDWRVLHGGKGPLILALHGAGASACSMGPLADCLTDRYTIVAPDLPGHGMTRLGSRSRSGLGPMAADVAAMVNENFGQPVAIVGHSAGGAIALATDDAWSNAPRILINPALAPFDGAAGWVFPRLARALSSAPFATSVLSRSFANKSRIQGLLRQTGSAVSDEAVERYQALASSEAHVRGTLNMMAQWDVVPLRDRLPAYEAPTFFILGKNDRTVSPDMSKIVAGRMPFARIREVDGGHLLHEEDPGTVADLIVVDLAKSHDFGA